jgi:hypothetical protein
MVERMCELVAAARDMGRGGASAQRRVGTKKLPGLFDPLAAGKDLTGHDAPGRFVLRRSQALCDGQSVCTHA